MEQQALKSYLPLPPMDEGSIDINTSYAQILHFIEGSPKVIDFGCGPGNLARFLTQPGCTVVGVDINPDSAGIAREYCAEVLVADLETTSLLKLFPNERFDVAIFADILEHLRKPERLLAETMRILRPGAYVIASIPNIAHGAIRLAMLKGEFNYQEIGVLDETHLRFFTRKTAEALFESAGLFIEEVARTTAPIFEPSAGLVPVINRADFSDEIAARIEADAEAETVQFVIKAVPAASSESRYRANMRKTAALSLRVQELEEKLHAAEAQLAEKLDAPTREHLANVESHLHLALHGPDGVEALRTQLHERGTELDDLREQMGASATREESARRYQKKLEKLNRQAAQSIVQVKQEVTRLEDEVEATRNDAAHARTQARNLEALYESTEAHRLELNIEIEKLREAYVKARHSHLTYMRETEKLRAELAEHKRAARELTARCERYEIVLDEMRKSKFWRLRNNWFSIKRAFGITTDIP